MDFKNFDRAIVDPDTYSHPESYHALLADLRARDPLHWTEPEGYEPFWTVSKHADIMEIERQPKIFENGPRSTAIALADEEKIKAHTGGRRTVQESILAMNGAEHLNFRNHAREFFLPRSIFKLQDSISELAREHVDRMVALGDRCEFVKEVAVTYPLRTIMMIFGLPRELEPTLLRLAKEQSSGQDPSFRRPGLSWVEHRIAVMTDFFDLFRPIVAERRANPRDDLASVMANARTPDGEYLPEGVLLSFYMTICVAGHDTTSEALAGGLLALLQHPEQLAKLRADPELMPSAVEEIMRWTTPLKHFFRNAVEDYELRGKKIKAGQGLLIAYPSANRDEEVFPDADVFRIDRSPNPILTFAAGPHICLGQFLAREELKIFYRELLARFDEIELAGTPAFTSSTTFGGLKHFPISYGTRATVPA